MKKKVQNYFDFKNTKIEQGEAVNFYFNEPTTTKKSHNFVTENHHHISTFDRVLFIFF